MYKGLFDATQNVLNSIEKAGTVQRLVYTSSCAAVMGPAPPGHEFTEDDWAGAGDYESLAEKWQGAWTIEKNAYAVGKVECERMTYAWGARRRAPRTGFYLFSEPPRGLGWFGQAFLPPPPPPHIEPTQ